MNVDLPYPAAAVTAITSAPAARTLDKSPARDTIPGDGRYSFDAVGTNPTEARASRALSLSSRSALIRKAHATWRSHHLRPTPVTSNRSPALRPRRTSDLRLMFRGATPVMVGAWSCFRPFRP